MFLESLIRLAEIIDYYKQNNDHLISEKFHNDTEELIRHQSAFLASELQFKKDNPGPYSFGFADTEINIFSPDQTEEQEWAAIIRKGNEQKNYRFNSIMGLIKILVLTLEINNNDQRE